MATLPGGWPGVLRTDDMRKKLADAKVLCVGAGGIGCELLKTLVLTGVQNIEVIDLDTIETSNLNRQFLFRRHHVGKSKAQTAADVVKSFKPEANIIAHHGNIKETRFDINFFQRFDIVLNGLDNLEARRHVNRMCLASNRPLIESGTAGYLGQVTPLLKGRTCCFECEPKPVPKSFPVCTIRNTPDKPIHCVVWAKELLFQRLFGPKEAVTDLDEQASGQDGTGEPGTSQAAAAEDPSFFQRREGEASLAFAARMFDRLYKEDIERVCGMEELWKSRPPPSALHRSQLLPDLEALAEGGGPSAAKTLGLNDPHKLWSTADNAGVLLKGIALFLDSRPADVGFTTFDKDDALAVEIVTAASNLRATCYGIPTQTLFAAKGMAGNIIHAIATTNAIVAGLIAVEALKVLAGQPEVCWNELLFENPNVSRSRGRQIRRLVQVNPPDPPKPNCMVCGQAQLLLCINTRTTTLAQMLNQVVRKRLAVNMPTLLSGDFMYEEGEGLEEDEIEANAALLPRPLAELPGGGIRGGTILTVNDQQQHFSVVLVIAHQEAFDTEQYPEGFILEGEVPAAKAGPSASSEPSTNAAAGAATGPPEPRPVKAKAAVEDADGVLSLLDDDEPPAVPDLKRKRPMEAEAGPSGSKKAKAAEVEDEYIIDLC